MSLRARPGPAMEAALHELGWGLRSYAKVFQLPPPIFLCRVSERGSEAGFECRIQLAQAWQQHIKNPHVLVPHAAEGYAVSGEWSPFKTIVLVDAMVNAFSALALDVKEVFRRYKLARRMVRSAGDGAAARHPLTSTPAPSSAELVVRQPTSMTSSDLQPEFTPHMHQRAETVQPYSHGGAMQPPPVPAIPLAPRLYVFNRHWPPIDSLTGRRIATALSRGGGQRVRHDRLVHRLQCGALIGRGGHVFNNLKAEVRWVLLAEYSKPCYTYCPHAKKTLVSSLWTPYAICVPSPSCNFHSVVAGVEPWTMPERGGYDG